LLPASAAGADDGAGARDPAEVVTIASMNLHCGIGTRGQPFDVEAAIESLDAQVIALQEVWSSDGAAEEPIDRAAKAMGAELLRVPGRTVPSLAGVGVRGPSRPGRTGMALLTTLPVVRYEVVPLGQMPGDASPRSAQVVRLTLPAGGPLRIACTHLTHRMASPVQLGRLMWHLAGDPAPTVIVGDLNMPRQVARLAPGYTAVVRGRTWPAELPVVQIDHVLAGRGIGILGGAVLPPAGSDHLPVRARVSVPRGSGQGGGPPFRG
jgi:endonuclease/exonuclease/phosphatase family metal-dependent hydrolase